jgi:hypothetical protein
MENKKIFVGFLLVSLLFFGVVPYSLTSAQSSCNPDALKPVSYGQRGSAVKNLQLCLIEAGYNIPAGATGYYGSQTAKAVSEFYSSWYGKWDGKRVGSKGVSELRNLLAGGTGQEIVEQPQPEQQQQQQPQTGVPQEVLTQVLAKIMAGDTAGALALLAPYMGSQLPPVTTTQQTQTTTQQPSVQEGNLTVEKASQPPANIPLREGETATVLGIRFRATQGDVIVQRIRINWPISIDAPFRVISRVELVDDSGNSLWSSNVSSAEGQPFYRETSGQYYLLITGLNFAVAKDQTKNVYLKATAVSTYPSTASGKTVNLEVPSGGVRAVTSGGSVNLFEPQSGSVSNSFLTQTTLAQNAGLSIVRTSDTPQERNVVATELVSGTGTAAIMRLTQDVPLIKVRLTAQNDNIKLRQLVATYTASVVGPNNFYLEVGGRRVGSVSVDSSNKKVTFDNLYSDNVTVPMNQSVDAVIGVSWLENVGYNGDNLTLTVATTTFENSLGAVDTVNPQVTSFPVNFYAVAPNFVFTGNVSATRDQNLTTTTLSFTGSITVSVPIGIHAGGQVRISSSSPFDLQWERSNTNATSSVTYIIQNVRDANNNLVSQSGGYYILNAGDSYKFELTAQYVAAGNFQGRVRVNSITWAPGNSGSFVGSKNSTYVSRDFVTGFSN